MGLQMLRAVLYAAGAVSLLLATTGADAGGAMRSEHELNYSARVGFTTATEGWDEQGDLVDRGCTAEYTSLSHELEYGYSYYYTLFGQTDYAHSKCGVDSKQGVRDFRVGIRGRLDPRKEFRVWELDLTVPVAPRANDVTRLGCGAHGLGASISQKNHISPLLSISSGLGVQIWESPLSHQIRAQVSGSGPITRFWGWHLGLTAEAPISDNNKVTTGGLSDCGSNSQVLRSSGEIKHSLTPDSSLGCGVSVALWGKDVSRSRGYYCGYSHNWP